MDLNFKKIVNYLETKKGEICLVSDFDHTITSFNSETSIGVFSKYLPKSYQKRKEKIDNQVNLLDGAHSTNQIEYDRWWTYKRDLLREYVKDMSIIEEIVIRELFAIRPLMKEIIKYSFIHHLPFYIYSSGCGELIEKVLIKNNLYYNNIKIRANYIERKPFNEKIISPLSKDYQDLLLKYHYLLIWGDRKEDFPIKKEANFYQVLFSRVPFKSSNYEIIIEEPFLKKEREFKTKKGTYGIGQRNGQKVFYKENNQEVIDNEKRGYNQIKEIYRTPLLLYTDDKIIIYEYQEELIKETLHEYLYINKKLKVSFNSLFKSYKESLQKIKKEEESKTKNSKYFNDRIPLMEKYLDDDDIIKEYKVEEKNYFLPEIIKEIINNIKANKKVSSYLSQGDLTDTNITINGLFSDFEIAGLNSFLGEIAIMVASFLTHGCYFYPKYHQEAYQIRPFLLNHYQEYKPKVKLQGNTIEGKLPSRAKNRELLLNFLNLYKENLKEKEIKELDKYLKYYLCARMITPLDITKMTKEDKIALIYYVIVFYQINSFDDLITLIKN